MGTNSQLDETQSDANALRHAQELYRQLFDSSSDALFVLNATGQLLEANQVAVQRYGYTRAELLTMSARDLAVPELHPQSSVYLRQALETGAQFEWRHRRKDGTEIPVEIGARPVTLNGERCILSSVRDITERKHIENQHRQITRLYATLSQINQTIVRVQEPLELYQAICQVAVQYGEFALAWIGILERATGCIIPVANAGANEGYVESLQNNLNDPATGYGPTGTALRTGKIATSGDIQSDVALQSWRNHALARDFRASVSVPFRLQGETIGALNLYVREPFFFSAPEEIKLLQEISLDISYALDAIQVEAERRRAENALRESEQKWSVAFAKAPFASSLSKIPSGILLDVNEAFEKIFGYTKQDAIGKTTLELGINPDASDRREQIMQELRTRGTLRDIPFMLVTKSGERRECLVNLDLIHTNGQDYLLQTTQDITERVRAAESLRESEARYRLIADNAADVIWVLDPFAQKFLYVSPSVEKLRGYTPAEVMAQPINEVMTPDSLERVTAGLREYLPAFIAQGSGTRTNTTLVDQPRKDGSIVHTEVITTYMFNPQGKVEIIGVTRDITERKHAEDELRKSRERYQNFVQQSYEAIYSTEFDEPIDTTLPIEEQIDAIYQYAYMGECNQAMAAMYGLASPDAFVGQRMIGIHGGKDNPINRATFRQFIEGNYRALNVETEEVTPDGERRWFISNNVGMVEDGHLQRIWGTSLDITERKRAEAMRQNLYDMLNASLNELYVFDAQTLRFEFVSAGALRNLGYTLEQMRTMTPLDLKPAITARMFQELIEPLRRRQTAVIHFETWHRRADASMYPVEAHLQLFDQDDHQVFLAVILDITERKRAEDTLSRSEQNLRAVISSNVDGMIVVDDAGFICFINPAAVNLLDRPVAKLLEQPFGIPIVTGEIEEIEVVRSNGTTGTVEMRATRMTWEGAPALLVSLHDISERKRAESALRESEERLELVMEGSQLGYWDWDILKGDVHRNERWAEMLGYTLQEIEFSVKQWMDLHHPDDRELAWKSIQEHLDGKTPAHRCEYRMQAKDGQYKWILDQARVVKRDSNGKPLRMSGTHTDITERKQAESRIQRQVQQLDALRSIDTAISSNFSLSITLDILLKQAISQLHVDASAVLLFNPHLTRLEFAAGIGFRTDAIQRSKLRLGESMAGRVALERRHLSISFTVDSEAARRMGLAEEDFVVYHGVPLLARGQLKGVLEVFHRQPLVPDDEWLNFLETLAGQAAIAVDNIQLFENLQRSNLDLALAYDATIEGWSRALDLRDKETEGHTQRVVDLTLDIARALGVPETDLVHIRRGALLHDIGKLGVPDAILFKPAKFTDDEWKLMQQHPVFAHNMLAPIAYLRPALDIPYCHHEKWDGTGYPRGLKGEQIPLAARIFAIVDVWDALRSDRPYRKGWHDDQVHAHICAQSGTHFDPHVVAVFEKLTRV